jgi:enamine deaminase RidA (YjgF/YER057c/UK114 family)
MDDLIQRFGISTRSSLAVSYNGIAYFAATPKAPYNGNLAAAEQAAELLEKATERLALVGSGKDKLLFVAILLADMADYDAVNTVWDGWVAAGNPPARACWKAELANPALKVEMIMVAACGVNSV